MAGRFTRKAPKVEAVDKSFFTCHDMHKLATVEPSIRWQDRDYITCISIDPGIVNLCTRIERRPIRGNLTQVEVLHHENVSFKEFTDMNPVGSKTTKRSYIISRLYGEITKYMAKFMTVFPEINMVVIERQMAINYKSVRISQHLISSFQAFLATSPLEPLILEVDAKIKSNVFAPKGISDSQIKDWAVEKALQLCFLRRDWESFHNIIHAPRKKCDDLSDTIVQLEAVCHRLNFPTTVMPINWDTIPAYVGWQSGMIFFRHLMVLIRVSQIAPGIKGWINLLQSYEGAIMDERDNYVFDLTTRQLIHHPKIRISATQLFAKADDTSATSDRPVEDSSESVLKFSTSHASSTGSFSTAPTMFSFNFHGTHGDRQLTDSTDLGQLSSDSATSFKITPSAQMASSSSYSCISIPQPGTSALSHTINVTPHRSDQSSECPLPSGVSSGPTCSVGSTLNFTLISN